MNLLRLRDSQAIEQFQSSKQQVFLYYSIDSNSVKILTPEGNQVTSIASGGSQAAVQFQEEGGNLGSSGDVSTLNFTGTNITASRIGNTVTVAVAGGGVTDGDKGDIIVSSGGSVWTIDTAVVSNSKLVNMPANTFKANPTGGSSSPQDITVTQAKTLLNYQASEVANTPSGNIASTTVQGALDELDSEKISTTLPSGQFIIGGPTNIATATTMTGDASMTNAGVISVVQSTDTQAGKVELATAVEVETGSDSTRAITPAGGEATYIKKSMVDAKGDILVATADNTPTRLAASATNNEYLVTDSSTATGLKWSSGIGIPQLKAGEVITAGMVRLASTPTNTIIVVADSNHTATTGPLIDPAQYNLWTATGQVLLENYGPGIVAIKGMSFIYVGKRYTAGNTGIISNWATDYTFGGAGIFNKELVDAFLPWASGAYYPAGAFVYFSNMIFRCNTAHTAGGSFSPTNWDLFHGNEFAVKTANYTATSIDSILDVDTSLGNVTITLPDTLPLGKTIVITKISSLNTLSVVSTGGKLLVDFDGVNKATITSTALNTSYRYMNGSVAYQLT
jgi:hypothetical protein